MDQSTAESAQGKWLLRLEVNGYGGNGNRRKWLKVNGYLGKTLNVNGYGAHGYRRKRQHRLKVNGYFGSRSVAVV